MLRAAALAAACALVLAGAPSARAAVSCDAVERGTLGADGTFTPGAESSDTDYRIACRGDGGEEDEVNWGHLHASGVDALPREVRHDPATRVVVDVDNTRLNLGTNHYPDDDGSRYRVVVAGRIRGSGVPGTGANVYAVERAPHDLVVDSVADIRMTGGAQGILVAYGEDVPGASIRARNFGHIRTEGEGTGVNPARAHGVNIWARAGDAEFVNEAGATIETRGRGARGAVVFGGGPGAATTTVVNRGSITVRGDPITNPDGTRRRTADGVFAGTTSFTGTVRAINDAGGSIRAEGERGKALHASTCYDTGQGCDPAVRGHAVAINRGTVTTTGGQAAGVDAHGAGARATAQVANESGGTIVTSGLRSPGLRVASDGTKGGEEADAEALNAGSITTSGDRAHGIVLTAM